MITYPTDKLQKVLLGGGCEQRNLPSGFTQVEWLGSDSQAYIDTGIAGDNNNLEIGIEFEYNTYVNYGGVFGNWVSDEHMATRCIIANTQNCVYINHNSKPSSPTNVSFTISTKHNVIINHSAVFVDGKSTFNVSATGIANNGNMALFNRSITNPNTERNIGLKVYSWYVKDNGVLIQRLIPCRRNSDSVLGMYDTVSQTFLTNVGTGTFTAGADVVPTPDNPMDIVCNNGVVKVSPNLYNVATRINGYYISTEGVITAQSASCYSELIPVKPNTYYTYSGEVYTIYTANKRLHAYDANGNWIQQINYTSISSPQPVPFSVSGQTPANCSYVRISGSLIDTDVQLEQGSTATPYMPYGQIYVDGTQEVVTDNLGNTANAEMLLGVGDYKDTQEVLGGNVTRNVGIKVLDGTEVWECLQQNNKYFSLLRSNISSSAKAGENLEGYCSHFKVLTSSPNPWRNQIGIGWGSSYLHINYNNEIGSLSSFKQFLADQYNAGTPVIIVYPLARPTTEQVTPQPLAGNTATVTAGSIDNLPIESSTIAELKKRYIGDTEVKKVYIGDNLVWSAE